MQKCCMSSMLLPDLTSFHPLSQALVLLLCAVIFACFVYELAAVKPVWLDVAKGFIPRPEIITNTSMLYVAIGILGETHLTHPQACASPLQWNVQATAVCVLVLIPVMQICPSWLLRLSGGY